jgi:lactate racemase
MNHEILLPYGNEMVNVKISEENLAGVFLAKPIAACSDVSKEIKAAIAAPLDTPPISEIIRPNEKVVILVDDHTRNTPADQILPHILAELLRGGISKRDIIIMITHGTHRLSSEEEVRLKVGKDVYNHYRIEQHSCTDEKNQVFLGVTGRGTPVWVNRLVVEADRCFGIGHIGPSPYAGYSGGSKLIVPGVAALDTINTNHSLVVLGFREFGRVDIPCRVDIEEAAAFVKLDQVVNVVMSQEEEIIKVLAGSPGCVYKTGVSLARQIFEVPCPGGYDIVITSAFPYDIDLYQAVRAVEYAESSVRTGGSVLLVASCPSGTGEDGFYQLMADKEKRPEDYLRDVARRNGKVTFSVLGYALARIKSEKRLFLLTDGIPDDQVNKMGFQKIVSLQDGLDGLMKEYGPHAKTAVFPHGSATIPVAHSVLG